MTKKFHNGILQPNSNDAVFGGGTVLKFSFKIFAITSAVTAITTVSIIGAGVNDPPISTASDIVPSLNDAREAKDLLPPEIIKEYSVMDADISNSRYLGTGKDFSYYAVSSRSDEICIIPIDAQSKTTGMACTKIENFEAYGLRYQAPNAGEQVWLISPETGNIAENQNIKSSTVDKQSWERVAPNFLILSTK